MHKMIKSKEVWQAQLSPDQFRITREKATERAYSGEYVNCYKDGIYHCVCCGQPLFDSINKYDAGCGWPCFTQPVESKAIVAETSLFAGFERMEVACSRCDAHLGYVFDDGPEELRYCLNSAALKLRRRMADKNPL